MDFQSEQFQLCLMYKSPRCFIPSFKSTGLSVQKKKRKSDPLIVPIGPILAICDPQVTPMVPTKFQGKGRFDSGEKNEN